MNNRCRACKKLWEEHYGIEKTCLELGILERAIDRSQLKIAACSACKLNMLIRNGDDTAPFCELCAEAANGG